MKDSMILCQTTGEFITTEEKTYRDEKRNDLLKKLELQFGKTREQVLALFSFYSPRNSNK